MAIRFIFICVPLLVFVMVVSWLIAITLEHYSGHHNWSMLTDSVTVRNRIPMSTKQDSKNRMKITDEYRNIFTFVQVSDIHISKFRNAPEISSDFKKFCREYFPLIKPKVVLLTGDLTDAKAKNNIYSRQYLDEWVSYKEVVDYCNNQFRTVWLDVKGNHDAFGVPNSASDMHLYGRFGSSRELFNNSRFSKYVLKTDFGKYAFNGLDLTPYPGPKRPFNFFGMLTQEDIESFNRITTNNDQFNLSVWFGHYPLSVTTMPSYIREKIQNGIVYLCGHLHTLGGHFPQMYGRAHHGHLELESGDWKENRRYRILAIDHDMLSFVDKKFPEMPVILMTNPKDARFIVPEQEPITSMLHSTHIRVFVFSQLQVSNVIVSLDGNILCENAREAAEYFYVCPWNPKDYRVGIHRITIFVEDSNHRKSSAEIDFSLDGSKKLLDLLPGLLMLSNFCFLAKLFYFNTFIWIVIWPLCIRSWTATNYFGKIFRVLLRVTPQRIAKFSKMDHLFWPLFKLSLYLVIGPLFVGEIVPNSIGFCFVHGIYSNGVWIQEPFTYIYGTLLLITYNLPIMLFLGQQEMIKKAARDDEFGMHSVRKLKKTVYFLCKLVFVVVCVLFQIKFCHTILVCYGVLSLLLSPSALWAVLLALWLVYQNLQYKANSSNN